MGMKYFFLISLSMVLILGLALLVGAGSQLIQAVRGMKHGTEARIKPNHVLTGILNALGLSRKDRMTCLIWIFNALMLWPITLIVAIPLVNAFRLQDKRLADQIHPVHQPAIIA